MRETAKRSSEKVKGDGSWVLLPGLTTEGTEAHRGLPRRAASVTDRPGLQWRPNMKE